jgi:tRNA (cytidine32/uridine32-2'-O)-methyltransferase
LQPKNLTVVLVRPQEEGNVGAVARAMANMGLSELALVEPAVELGDVARARAVKARTLLDSAVRHPTLAAALAGAHCVVGTTASRGRHLDEEPLAARDLWTWLVGSGAERVALVFGPETSGLNQEELACCNVLVRIPTDDWLPTLNLSQAVLILAYELFLGRSGAEAVAGAQAAAEAQAETESPATTAQVEGLFGQLVPVLIRIGFARHPGFEAVVRDLRRLAAKSRLSPREVSILRGICRRAAARLTRLGG